ncbi:MAG: chromosomal replication initiator protein DnaA [Treponema sp.]|nr:chromosomal replication initiator protein DnaA [Treponema sp.]
MTETDDFTIIWNETLNQIRSEMDEQEFVTWFNLEFQKADEKEFTIAVPSLFYQDQVKKRYQAYIEGKIEELIGKHVSLNLVIKPRTEPVSPPVAETSANESLQAVKEAVKPKKNKHNQLRDDYNFDTYVVGENNSFAANAAQAIARNPGTAYNPFLIYGGVGLGKTHLMQAIGNYIHANSDSKVIYITAETFLNEFTNTFGTVMTGEGAKAAFKNKYRYADILLIDDIHILQNKPQTQEELFYTFNALYDANKQMVFTCDRPVSDLKNFNERLRSRVGRGLNVDLQPPNYETRCAILRKKADTSGITIPDDVIDLVSKNISTNIRDLESALNTLTAYARLVGKTVTLEIAQQRLKDVFASPRQSNISIEIIQRVTAEKYHLSPNDLKGKKRTQSIVYPRQLAMFICREITEYTTTEIGQDFGGRDHTTVMYSCQRIENQIRNDPTVDSTVQSLIRDIKDYSVKS